MKLFPKVIILIAAILLFRPVVADAAFVIKKAEQKTVQAVAAKESGSTAITTAAGSGYITHNETSIGHKQTFFGKIFNKASHLRESFSAGKKKWLAILLGMLDIFVLGGLGLPRFYMGYTSEGVMQLIFWLLGIVGCGVLFYVFVLGGSTTLEILGFLCIGLFVFSSIWQIVDVIRIMCNSLKPKEGYWD